MKVLLLLCVSVACLLVHSCHAQNQEQQMASHDTCEDKLSNCASYGSQACGQQYLSWATENCQQFCNLCPGATPTPATPCADKLTNCQDYGQQACGGQYTAWAIDNCQRFCNLCSCTDKLANCQQYGQYVCVGHYETWARDHCAKTCGLCEHSAQQNKTVQSPNPSCALPAGQTLLMKAVAGAPGDVYHLWTSPNTANTHLTSALTLDSHVVSHYKSDLVNNLDTCDFATIKVVIYKDCVEKASLTFNGYNSGQSDWFSADRLLFSSFVDLTSATAPSAHFSMAGDPFSGREFNVGGVGSGCDGSGWFFVSTRSTCLYETHSAKPAFYFASGHIKQPLRTGYLETGDVLAIFGQGGSCSQGVTTPSSYTGRTHSCHYKGQQYQQGQWWQDGCQFNCTCDNAATGSYKCFELCVTYTNLHPNCPLVKTPGQCCPKPSCDTIPQSGCMYKSQMYRQGQTWTDGCDYRCTCQDASTGKYSCTSRCPGLQLPAECHMMPPPANKCCSVPVCPANIQIQYPDGYQPE